MVLRDGGKGRGGIKRERKRKTKNKKKGKQMLASHLYQNLLICVINSVIFPRVI